MMLCALIMDLRKTFTIDATHRNPSSAFLGEKLPRYLRNRAGSIPAIGNHPARAQRERNHTSYIG